MSSNPTDHADRATEPSHEGGASVRAAIRRALEVVFGPGEVAELRAFDGAGGITTGYFDNLKALAREAARLDERGWQVFVTLNPVIATLPAGAPNRVSDRPRTTASDGDIAVRRWLLVDVDPVRPAGVCATIGEKTAAYHKAKDVRDHLRGEGWPEPVVADSGNGFHLLYRIDLPNDPEGKNLFRRVLTALASEFDDDGAKIDTAVHNAARLVRLYGTTNRKGAHSQERSHRRSQIKKVPEEA